MGDDRSNEGEWTFNLQSDEDQESEEETWRNGEWSDPKSIQHRHQKPIVGGLKHWSKRQWRNKLKPYAARLAIESVGIVMLGGVLAAAWSGISLEMIVEAMSVQGKPPTPQPWTGLMAGLGKFVFFWGAAWAGIAIIFSRAKDGRTLRQLLSKRPIRTSLWCMFLTVFSFMAVLLGWVVSRVVLSGHILNVAWWQSVAGIAAIVLMYAALIDWGYKGLYYQKS